MKEVLKMVNIVEPALAPKTNQPLEVNNRKNQPQEAPSSNKKPNSLFSFEFNEAGQITKFTEDQNRDGTADYVVTHEYNEAGQETKSRIVHDRNCDGKVDFIREDEYNEAGQETKTTVDIDGDGTADYVVTHEYNEAGQETKRTEDFCNGNVYVKEFSHNEPNTRDFGLQ